jgi:hypothetical protein
MATFLWISGETGLLKPAMLYDGTWVRSCSLHSYVTGGGSSGMGVWEGL